MPVRRVVYPGTFDPVHNGHLDIVQRAARAFDEVYVAVYETPAKKLLFNTEERVAMFHDLVKPLANVQVAPFSGLVVDYVRKVGGFAIVRGLRVFSDFELEFRMALANRRLASEIEVLNFISDEKQLYISSSTVREIAQLGGDVSSMVPELVSAALRSKFTGADRSSHNYAISLQD